MKKFSVLFAMLLVFGMAGSAMSAPLAAGTLLTITQGVSAGPGQPVTSGSWFGMDAYSTGNPANYVPTPMGPGSDGGMIVGQTQFIPAQNNPGGPWLPSGITGIWSFFGGNGINAVGNPAANTFDLAGGTATMGSWDVHWNGGAIPMGGGIFTNVALSGNAYTLDYLSTVPSYVPQWGNVGYSLHLEGNVVAIPEPASLLLIGTGLVGILGIGRKMKK